MIEVVEVAVEYDVDLLDILVVLDHHHL